MSADADRQRPLDYAAPRGPSPPDPSQLQAADIVVMVVLVAAGVVALAAAGVISLINVAADATATPAAGGAIIAGVVASLAHYFTWTYAKPEEVRLPGGRWWHVGVLLFWAALAVTLVIANVR